MKGKPSYLIQLRIDDKVWYFTGKISEDLMPKYTVSLFNAKQYPSKEKAKFAQFYFSLHDTTIEEHVMS